MSSGLTESPAQQQRRQLIRAVMQDPLLSDTEKARKVQALFMEPLQNAAAETSKPKDDSSGTLTEADLKTTYQDEGSGIQGCPHYQQGCKILAPCCNRWFTCRLCHEAVADHEIDRYAIETMLCMECKTVQPVAQQCRQCDARMADYYCSICHIWENKPDRPIYHCDDCRICRVGHGLGVDYFHCATCDICMSVSMRNKHKCVEKSLHSNCPICFEYMFTSTKHVVFMRCGHSIHSHCYDQYRRTSYQCPLCGKSHQDMKEYFLAIDALLRKQPMPVEFSGWRSSIFCNDCGMRSVVPYHFEYHKCPQASCGSYNTNVLSVEKNPPLASALAQVAPEETAPTEVVNPTAPAGVPDLENVLDNDEVAFLAHFDN